MDQGDFTPERVAAVLGIPTAEADLFSTAPRQVAAPWLSQTLGRRTQLG